MKQMARKIFGESDGKSSVVNTAFISTYWQGIFWRIVHHFPL